MAWKEGIALAVFVGVWIAGEIYTSKLAKRLTERLK